MLKCEQTDEQTYLQHQQKKVLNSGCKRILKKQSNQDYCLML